MIQKQQIIISYFRQGISQRKISRELSISRKTVKKYIDEYKTERQCPNKDSKGIIRVPRYDSSSRTRPKVSVFSHPASIAVIDEDLFKIGIELIDDEMMNNPIPKVRSEYFSLYRFIQYKSNTSRRHISAGFYFLI